MLSIRVINTDERRDVFASLCLFAQNIKCFSSKRMNWWNTNVIPLETPWKKKKKVKHDLSARNFSCHVNFQAITQLPTLPVSGCNSCKINLCSSSCEARVPSTATELCGRAVRPASPIVTQIKLPSRRASPTLLDRSKHAEIRGGGKWHMTNVPSHETFAPVHFHILGWKLGSWTQNYALVDASFQLQVCKRPLLSCGIPEYFSTWRIPVLEQCNTLMHVLSFPPWSPTKLFICLGFTKHAIATEGFLW